MIRSNFAFDPEGLKKFEDAIAWPEAKAAQTADQQDAIARRAASALGVDPYAMFQQAWEARQAALREAGR